MQPKTASSRDAKLPRRYLPGDLTAQKSVGLSPTVKGGLWVGLDASMCESSSRKMRMGS